MYKYKEKIGNILNKIKGNKRILYLTFCTVLVLSCLVLNMTFSFMTQNKNLNEANITIGDLKYKMVINEVELNESVGTKLPSNTIIGDRIILLKAGKTEQFNVSLISKNNFDTKYEIIYKVCTDENCTSFIDTPTTIEIFYQEDMPYISGTINAEKTKVVTLITNNQDNKDYYVQINLNAGYSHNELTAINQIVSPYSISTIKSNLSILAYVNGTEVTTFPTTENYNASVSCKSSSNNSNIVGTVRWNSSKWIINVASIDSKNTVCTVYFVEKNAGEIEAPTNWYQAAEGTLLAALRKNNIVGNASTVPGKEISNTSEAVLAKSQDDYGTTFYFRGAVENNYVVFAGMCWRIVRITGDGSIKLTLFNRNDNSRENPCNETGTNLAFAKYDGSNMASKFNTGEAYNAYVGFMYGTTGSNSYAAEHANKSDSTILTNLKTWYNLKLRNYNDQLSDTIWCNDKSIYSGNGYTGGSTEYAIVGRIHNGKSNPTFICPTINISGVDNNLSKFTSEDTINGNGKLKGKNGSGSLDYKIGLLTADEVAYAGAVWIWDNSNTSFYLYKNAGSSYWTMTPGGKDSNWGQTVMYVYNSNFLYQQDLYNGNLYVRPAISLLPSASITSTSGSGTATNPYIIKTS